MLAQKVGAVGAESLLVGHGGEDQGTLRAKPAPGEAPERDGHRGGDVQHVDSAPAPNLALDELTAERVTAPIGSVHGHNVGVTEVTKRRRARIAPLDARHERDAARQRLIALEVAAGALEEGTEHGGICRLVTRVVGALVDTGVADQLLQQLDNFWVAYLGVVGHVASPVSTLRHITTWDPMRGSTHSSPRVLKPACS